MRTVFEVRGEYIQLDQLLKAAGLVASGGAAHVAVEAGHVSVDGRTETRKRAKLRAGQLVRFRGSEIALVASAASEAPKVATRTGLAFRLVNVFATDTPLSGNPLCVFEDGQSLSDADMLALAIQFNLSETTFILPSERADARVRIFTPNGEMPFAGHPTLGTAAVVRDLRRGGDRLTLEMQAGVIPVTAGQDVFTLQANAPQWREPGASRADLARMLGLEVSDIGEQPLWMSTGMMQMLIPLESEDALRRARPVADLASRWANDRGMVKIYAWHEHADGSVSARFFFEKQPGVIAEDPGTGSACANLGGWLIAASRALPVRVSVHQGDHLGRACRLGLEVDAEREIFVSGRVVEIGRGVVSL
jgi:trans-2,3-dihydro-3-hydroxyanthranilate isomerase